MDSEQIELSKKLLESKWFRWVPGMLVIWPNGNEFRVAQVNGIDGVNDLPNYPSNGWGDDYPDKTAGIPDLSDPATLGCLVFLVREKWGSHAVSLANGFEESTEVWSVHDGRLSEETYGHQISSGSSKVEALINSLEVIL